MKKTIAIIALMLSITVVIGQIPYRSTSIGTKYVDIPRHYSAMQNQWPVFPADSVKVCVDTLKNYCWTCGTTSDLGSAAAVIESANYSKFEWGQTDTIAVNRLYSYVFFYKVAENANMNKGLSRGRYSVDQVKQFNGEFSIELDAKTKQFKQVHISGDSTDVMEAVGQYAILGSQVEYAARLYPGKKITAYVGSKKYQLTIKPIK